jgi:hypothetical protein
MERGFGDLASDPEMSKRMQKIMTMPTLRALWRGVGPVGLIRVMRQTNKEVERMRTHDWSSLKRRGFDSQPLLDMIVQNVASMKVLADMVGMEKAQKILGWVMEETVDERMAVSFVPTERFMGCKDPFAGFVEYFKAFSDASEREGVHEIEVKEDTDDVFAFDVTYCAWYEIAKAFGDPGLGYPSCYNDDVFYPKASAQLGFRYTRTGTLCFGAPVCDFRFERV